MITWGLISVGMMFVQGELELLRRCASCSAPPKPASCPASSITSATGFRASYRAKAVSWFMIGIPLSVVFGGAAVGLVVQASTATWACMAGSGCSSSKACPPCCSASWCSASSPRSRRTRAGSRAAQRGWLSAAHRGRTRGGAVAARRRACGGARRIPTVWLLALIMFCCQTGSYGLTFWVPTDRQGPVGIHRVRSGVVLGACPTSPPRSAWCWSALSSDRTGERFMHVAIPSADRRRRASSPPDDQLAGSRDGRAGRRRRRRLLHARAVLGDARQVPHGQRAGRRASR